MTSKLVMLMRPVEAVLLLAVGSAFVTSALGRLRVLRWAGFVAPLAVVAGVVQVLVEGPRWQMIPAYGLAGVFFAGWLVGRMRPMGSGTRGGRAVRVVGAVLGAVAVGVAVALPVVLPVFRFQRPTGPYGVGTVTYHWVEAREELVTADPGDRRELVAQVWYPAEDDPSAPRAPYVPDAGAVEESARLIGLPGFLLSHFEYVTTNAVEGAPVARGEPAYPVLVYLTGRGGFRSVSTFQVEELVSHGYVVAGLDQPGASAAVSLPGGRRITLASVERMAELVDQSVEPLAETPRLHGRPMPDGIIPYLAADVGFTLDRLEAINASDPRGPLTGRLDLGRAGVFGVSLGGMNAAEACAGETRLKACLIMDAAIPAGAVRTGLRQPAMFLTRDAATMRLERERSGGWPEKDIEQTLGTMRGVYERLPGDGYYVEIPNLFHVGFTDLPYWSPITAQLGLTGPLDARRGLDIVNDYSVAFFDKELKGRRSPLLDGPSRSHPEARIEVLRH